MKPIDLNSISYKQRFSGASLLISKANRLSGMSSFGGDQTPDDKTLLAALAHYDMALALLKPFDPNYATVVNWKCNVLGALRQYEEAVAWYREIVRISDATDGKSPRNATAALAEKMIRQYEGRGNEPLRTVDSDASNFDDPPFCMFAEEVCLLLSEKKYKKFHACLSPALQGAVPVAKLKEDWQRMTQGAAAADLTLTLEQHTVQWPDRKADEIGWCYFSVSTEGVNEAIAVVVGRTPQNGYWITELEFGRP